MAKVRVSAVFEVEAKLASQLEGILRDTITPQFPCTLLEVKNDAEPIQQQSAGSEDAGGAGRVERSDGNAGKPGDARKDGLMARIAGKVRSKSGGQNANKGGDGPA